MCGGGRKRPAAPRLRPAAFRNKLVVLVNWAWGYFFYDRPVRLIVRAAQAPPGEVPGSAVPRGEASAGDPLVR